MEFYFVKLRNINAPQVMIDPKHASRYICFKDINQAARYRTFVSKHCQKFGNWPKIDLTEEYIEVKNPKDDGKSLAFYESMFEVELKSQRELDILSITNGISYFYCHHFDYEDLLTINFSGQEIDGNADHVAYVNNINYRLKEMD